MRKSYWTDISDVCKNTKEIKKKQSFSSLILGVTKEMCWQCDPICSVFLKNAHEDALFFWIVCVSVREKAKNSTDRHNRVRQTLWLSSVYRETLSQFYLMPHNLLYTILKHTHISKYKRMLTIDVTLYYVSVNVLWDFIHYWIMFHHRSFKSHFKIQHLYMLWLGLSIISVIWINYEN